jgi:hypothetical protein
MGILDTVVPITNLAYRTSVHPATGPITALPSLRHFPVTDPRHKTLLSCRIVDVIDNSSDGLRAE